MKYVFASKVAVFMCVEVECPFELHKYKNTAVKGFTINLKNSNTEEN